jgi:hypothetical protein
MANICTNRFYLSCEKNLDKYIDFIQPVISEWNGDIDCVYYDYTEKENSGGYIEGYFDSKWTFPNYLKEDLEKVVSEEDKLYFRCLSEEYGCGYVGMNIFENGAWWDEQTFDL